MRRIPAILALVLATAALSAGSALADDGVPGGKPVGKGPLVGLLAGHPGARAALPAFTCKGAKARLAVLNRGITIVNARIQSGTAKNPEGAARLVQLAKARAAKINARIAANCG